MPILAELEASRTRITMDHPPSGSIPSTGLRGRYQRNSFSEPAFRSASFTAAPRSCESQAYIIPASLVTVRQTRTSVITFIQACRGLASLSGTFRNTQSGVERSGARLTAEFTPVTNCSLYVPRVPCVARQFFAKSIGFCNARKKRSTTFSSQSASTITCSTAGNHLEKPM